MAILTLTTDFGLTDYYVAAVKGTLLRLVGDTPLRLVDLTHELPAGDIEAGADFLAAAVPNFPAGTVHLAVIDPGVGSDRRILVVETAGQLLVGPDNGLFTPFFGPAEDGARVTAVERSDLYLPSPGATFHGRDRFAPVAAALAAGTAPADLGRAIDDPERLVRPAPTRRELDDGYDLEGQVVRVDRFGNLITDLPAAWLEPGEDGTITLEAQIDGRSIRRLAGHYAELPAAEPAVIVGSLGTLEISLRDGSLARRWRVGRGARVRVLLR